MSALSNARRPDLVLFALAATALIACALAFAGGPGSIDPRQGTSRPDGGSRDATSAPLRRALARAQRREAALRRAASRFLSAFLRYEVGDAPPAVTALLRSASAPAFAGQLLAHPPRLPSSGELPEPAHLRRLHVAFLAGPRERALLSGTARRGPGSEEFSFLFERRHGRWLALGAGE